MHRKTPKWLDDVVRSCSYIIEDTAGATLERYLGDRLLRQVVERNLEIIGEALARIRAVDPDTASRIGGVHRIIGLRNRLAHGYDEEVDNALVWRAVQESLPTLLVDAEALLPEFEGG